MKNPLAYSRVKIPVRLRNGVWEFRYGGSLPITDGATAELSIDRDAIEDRRFVTSLSHVTRHRMLDAGTTLLAAMTILPDNLIDPAHRQHLLRADQLDGRINAEFFPLKQPAFTRFVAIKLTAKPARLAITDVDSGGLWVRIKGDEPSSVVTGPVELPQGFTDKPVATLNHGLTLLSKAFESHKKSNTASIYSRVLYQEQSGLWYPIGIMRQPDVARDEHSLVKARWADIAPSVFAGYQPNLFS